MHNRLALLAAAAFALASGGCSQLFPTPVSGTQSIVVVKYDPGAEAFSLEPENVTTLHDLRTMQGSAAKIYANATVNADYATLAGNPPAASGLQAAVVPNAGQPVDFDYFIVGSGIYPADTDALNVATAYYEVETAYLFFQSMTLALPSPVATYYFPTLSGTAGGPRSPTDLGTTDPWLGVFVIPPFTSASWEPPALQPGVVAYEYTQAVFAQQVFGGPGPSFLDVASVGSSMLAQSYAPTSNIIRSFDAGLADFFAAVIVQDPNFVHTSGAAVDPTRTLTPSAPRCLTSTIGGYTTALRDSYDPHLLGSIISAALYDSLQQPSANGVAFEQGVGASMMMLGQYLLTNKQQLEASPLTLNDLVQIIVASVAAVDAPAVPRLCAVLLDRLSCPGRSNPDGGMAGADGGSAPQCMYGVDSGLLGTVCAETTTLTGPTCANSQ